MDLIHSALDATPHALLYLALVAALSVVAASSARGVLHTSLVIAALILFSFGAIIVLTLTPSIDGGFSGGNKHCSTQLSSPELPLSLLHATQRSLNVALFVPFGFFVMFARGWQRKLVAAAIGFALPVVIEVAQYQFTTLGRTCETVDVLDNVTGFVYGAICGLLVHVTARYLRARSNTDDAKP